MPPKCAPGVGKLSGGRGDLSCVVIIPLLPTEPQGQLQPNNEAARNLWVYYGENIFSWSRCRSLSKAGAADIGWPAWSQVVLVVGPSPSDRLSLPVAAGL